MAAVTQKISNYLSGVSKQADSKKLPGQVRECLNGFPDVTLGLTKRPGFKFISKLKNGSGTDFSGTQLDGAKWFYINRSATKYIGCITPKVGGTNGTIHVWNADTGAACTITDKTATPNAAIGAHAYLDGNKSNYDVLTVDAATFITNNSKVITAKAAPTFVANSRGTILISTLPDGESSIQGQAFEIKIGNATGNTHISSSPRIITHTSGASDTYETILTALETKVNAENITGLTVTKYANQLQLDYVISSTRTPFTLEAKGGADNKRLVVYQDHALDEASLPPNSFHNHVVGITNGSRDQTDDIYAKFVADNSAAGSGYWKETLAPNISTGLTESTMPHRLVNTGATTFDFEEVPWEDRMVGSDITNPHPVFVGKTITKLFFHDARLGVLTEDNVVLSKATKPYDFYRITARFVSSGDRVSLNCASLRPCKLFSVKPFRQGLVLFAKNQQFLMYGEENGQLSPNASKIAPMSNMEMSDDVEPIDIGTHMNFISKTPNFVRVFAMSTKGLGESPDILDIGRVVNEWITIDVDTLVASVQNEFIAMSAQDSNEIYFYKTYSDGKELLMESWFKWSLPGTVQGLALDQDDMYCVTKQGNQYTISKSNLTQSPEIGIITNAQGQKINPCIDLYAQASSVSYDSANDLSKCYLPYANLADQKNVLIVAGTTAAGTFNNSGFTITPEVDSGGTYFIVPGQDLTSVASNVYVGYAYNFDVTLPQVHYQLDQDGKSVDYTASLTVARLKFDVGLSGVLGFKLKATGRFAGKREYTGDNSTTDFNWNVGDLDYVDRNQVKVKVNNVTNTAFTFQSDTEIRFSSAPATGDKILIYLDEWYQLQPVTSANTYLADDVPLNESTIFTLPIHQRSKNFTLRVFNDSPFPVSLNSMMWEGNYSPRFYRRT